MEQEEEPRGIASFTHVSDVEGVQQLVTGLLAGLAEGSPLFAEWQQHTAEAAATAAPSRVSQGAEQGDGAAPGARGACRERPLCGLALAWPDESTPTLLHTALVSFPGPERRRRSSGGGASGSCNSNRASGAPAAEAAGVLGEREAGPLLAPLLGRGSARRSTLVVSGLKRFCRQVCG